MTHKEQLISNCLNTKDGRDMLWDIAIKPSVKNYAKNVFSKFNREHQERWMDCAFGKEWRTKI